MILVCPSTRQIHACETDGKRTECLACQAPCKVKGKTVKVRLCRNCDERLKAGENS